MALVSDPSPEPVSPRPNTQSEGHHSHHRSYYSPSSLAAFASAGASPEAEWDDDVAAAESEDEAEWQEAAAAAAKSEDDVAAAESEDEPEWAEAAAESVDEAQWAEAAAAAESVDEAEWDDGVPAAESEDDEGGEADTGEPDSPLAWWPSNSACGDPRKLPPTAAGDLDDWPSKSPHWRRLRELRAMKSSPSNPVLNPDENSLSRPPSNKSKEILSDKVVDQRGDTKHSTNSASSQIVLLENGHGENPLPVPPKKIKYTIDKYAVQCGECLKWRLIPNKTKYDEIREKSRQVPFLCEHAHGWKLGVSCDDPTDISLDDGFWAIDKACISQTPLGWERTISIRSKGATFADVYYISPTGKKLRSMPEVEIYLQENPDCAVGLHEFSFEIPVRLQDYVKKRYRQPKHHRQPKRRRQSKPLEPNEVLPLSYAPPFHGDLAQNCLLALSDKTQDCM
ncbi:unnamed protein product [Alopecurus aequalis]